MSSRLIETPSHGMDSLYHFFPWKNIPKNTLTAFVTVPSKSLRNLQECYTSKPKNLFEGSTVHQPSLLTSGPATEILHKIIEVARLSGISIYLVGGSVRDEIIGLPLKDLDLVTLVKPDHFIATIIAELNAKLIYRSQYGTYKLIIGNVSVDVCMSRTEHYLKPAGKPVIHPASIALDMHRRDFSMNALALPLLPSEPTALIDPTKGLPDIKNKSIRVLHQGSFKDDPSRIIRAIRYEQRLAFNIEHTTLKLLLRDKTYLDLLPASKIRQIVDEVFMEKQSASIIDRILQLNLLPSLSNLLRTFNKHHFLVQSIATVKPSVKSFDIYVGISSWFLTNLQVGRMKTQLALTNRQMKLVDQVLTIKKLVKKIRNNHISLSDLYFKLKQTSELSRMIASHAISDNHFIELLTEYESKLKWIRPSLNNSDLCTEAGITEGPLLGKVIRAIIAAKIDGKISGKAEEIHLARKVVLALHG